MRLALAILILSVHLLFVSCSEVDSPDFRNTKQVSVQERQLTALSEEQAISRAETFISQNGYTDMAADTEKIAHESIEWESKVDKILKSRHNTLERKAFGVSTGRKGGSEGWTVVFRYKNRPKSENGRAVTMNLEGSEMLVEHVDVILAKIDRNL